MQIVPEHVARQRLLMMGAEVHHLKVTADQQVIIYRASVPAHQGTIRRIPALFVNLCISGGGRLQQRAGISEFDTEVGPGDMGISPPNITGQGNWPMMTTIAIGISVDSMAESFGSQWPDKLKRAVLTDVIRDPLVEATMMDVGYTRADQVSDSTLLHAAHMIAHQLIDRPFDDVTESEGVAPLSAKTVERIKEMLTDNLQRHVSVDEMAEFVGISRHHFSRRFKAATGETPHQFAIRGKLDHAAQLLAEEERSSVISIAQMIGYSNAAQFAKLFRRHFGLSPKSWRQRNSR